MNDAELPDENKKIKNILLFLSLLLTGKQHKKGCISFRIYSLFIFEKFWSSMPKIRVLRDKSEIHRSLVRF